MAFLLHADVALSALPVATKNDLDTQLRGQEEILDNVRQQVDHIRSIVLRLHQMSDLTVKEENDVWLMSVLPQVVDEAVSEGYERLFLKYDKNNDGSLSIDELALVAVDALKQSDSLIEVQFPSQQFEIAQSVLPCWSDLKS